MCQILTQGRGRIPEARISEKMEWVGRGAYHAVLEPELGVFIAECEGVEAFTDVPGVEPAVVDVRLAVGAREALSKRNASKQGDVAFGERVASIDRREGDDGARLQCPRKAHVVDAF